MKTSPSLVVGVWEPSRGRALQRPGYGNTSTRAPPVLMMTRDNEAGMKVIEMWREMVEERMTKHVAERRLSEVRGSKAWGMEF